MGILSAPAGVDKREYWGFSLYDWANSGYVTTVGTVLFAPYLTSVAETAACGYVGTTDKPCHTNLDVLGLGISPGSLAFYVVTVGTLVFGLVHQLTGSYRPAIVALGLFFVIGLALLTRVDMRRGIDEAGNTQPAVV